MKDSEIYKGWKIVRGVGMLSEFRSFSAIKINSPSGSMISGQSVDRLKAEIDALPPQTKGPGGKIPWTRIEEMPDYLRDGRDVLLHFPLEGLGEYNARVIIGSWNKKLGIWVWQGRSVRGYSECYQPDHYCELDLPE